MMERAKIARQIRGECGISANQLKTLVVNLSSKGLDVATIQQGDLQEHSEMLANEWKLLVDERHSVQMHRYILFAISEKYSSSSGVTVQNEGTPVLLPFSRQKIYISQSLAFEFIIQNSKFATCISSEDFEHPVLTASELRHFTNDYLNYLWSSPSHADQYHKELLSLTSINENVILDCWRNAPADGWDCLLNAVASTNSSQTDVLYLLCRLWNSGNASNKASNFRGYKIISRLYGTLSMNSDQVLGAGKDLDSINISLWARLAKMADADVWNRQLVADGSSMNPERLAIRDMLLMIVLSDRDFDQESIKPLRDGIYQYMSSAYSSEYKVLEKHMAVIEKQISIETDEAKELIRWLMFEIPPSSLIPLKSLMDILLRNVTNVSSPLLFQHLIKNWPSGEYLKPLLRRTFTELKSHEKIEIFKSLSEFCYPDGPQGWNKDLRCCLNRLSKMEAPSIIEELHLLVLYNAEGVLSAIVETAITNKGSFDLMLTVFDSLSFTFLLQDSRSSENSCLLSAVMQPFLQRVWARDLSDDQTVGWYHFCRNLACLDSVRDELALILLRLIDDLIVANLETHRSVTPIFRLAVVFIDALNGQSIEQSYDQDNIFNLFVFAIYRIGTGEKDSSESEDDDGDDDDEKEEEKEEEEAMELISRMQSQSFLPIICRPSLMKLLRFGQSIVIRLLCCHVFRSSNVRLSLTGSRLGRIVDCMALEELGCESGDDEDVVGTKDSVANFILLATSSNSAADVLGKAVSEDWLMIDEDAVTILTSALVHISYKLSRHAWKRIPGILNALLTPVRPRVTCNTLSGIPVSPLLLSECIVDLALFQIMYVTMELNLLSSLTSNPAKFCMETVHALLMDATRRCSQAQKSSTLNFFCLETLEWTKAAINVCPSTWTQAEGFQLVARELLNIVTQK